MIEIITTKSILICKTFGVAIEAVTSGQDGVEAARIVEEEKYPGMFDVLRNPWGSVYLNEGMYKLALQFLEDYVEKNGEIQIQVLYSEPSLQTDMVKAAIGRLLAFCNEENEGDLINLLYVRGSTSGMYEVPGWQPDLLNEAMIELLRKDCEDTAERIETNSYYEWQEKNKQHIRWYAEKGMEFAYASLILWDMTAEQTRASRQAAEVRKYAEEVKVVEKEAGEVEGGSGAQGVGNPVAVEGRGNTGRTVPNTLNEKMSMNQVQSNPLEGATKVPLEMTDPRWPASEGWVKMQSVVQNADGTKTTIHYVYNETTGAFDDFKFK